MWQQVAFQLLKNYAKHMGLSRSVEEQNKEDEKEQDKVPSFAKTYEALEKVKAFFYVHSETDADREPILGL
jgi:cAMP phosphodiesterase